MRSLSWPRYIYCDWVTDAKGLNAKQNKDSRQNAFIVKHTEQTGLLAKRFETFSSYTTELRRRRQVRNIRRKYIKSRNQCTFKKITVTTIAASAACVGPAAEGQRRKQTAKVGQMNVQKACSHCRELLLIKLHFIPFNSKQSHQNCFLFYLMNSSCICAVALLLD